MGDPRPETDGFFEPDAFLETDSYLERIDPAGVDWPRVRTVTFVLHQRFEYRYPSAVHDLRHCLVVVPPSLHGTQRLLSSKVEVTGARALASRRSDPFGNQVVEVRAPVVDECIEFEAWGVVRRSGDGGGARLRASAPAERAMLIPTSLTTPDKTIETVARSLAHGGGGPLAVAERINLWTHRSLTYQFGVTDVQTPAAMALALGHGVCQDYAHIMLALCRSNGIAARYVSGHLIGEGGSHAWVEVLMADPERPGGAVAVAFDPTHGRRCGITYLTVAVGRDYLDVAPTSGTFNATVPGRLSARKRLGVAAVDLAGA